MLTAMNRKVGGCAVDATDGERYKELLNEVLTQLEAKTELVIETVDKMRQLREGKELTNEEIEVVPLMFSTVADCNNIVFKLYRIDEQLSKQKHGQAATGAVRNGWLEISKARTTLEYHAADIEHHIKAGEPLTDIERRGLQAISHLQRAHTIINAAINAVEEDLGEN